MFCLSLFVEHYRNTSDNFEVELQAFNKEQQLPPPRKGVQNHSSRDMPVQFDALEDQLQVVVVLLKMVVLLVVVLVNEVQAQLISPKHSSILTVFTTLFFIPTSPAYFYKYQSESDDDGRSQLDHIMKSIQDEREDY